MGYTREYYIGDEALQLKGVLKLMYPIEHGKIEDFTAIEKILHYTFYTELRIDPSENLILFPYNPIWSRLEKEKLLEILFETFNIPELFLVDFYKLILYEKKIPNAIIFDFVGSDLLSGVYLNYRRQSIGSQGLEMGTQDLVVYMQRLLRQKGISFTTSAEREIVRDIVEKMCYFSLDPASEMKKPLEPTMYVLPDGTAISIDKERFIAPEFLFNPSVIGKECLSLDVFVKGILKEDSLRNFFENNGHILWGGQIPLLPNFLQRISKLAIPTNVEASRHLQISYPEIFENIYSIDLIKTNFFKYLINLQMYKSGGPSYVLDVLEEKEREEIDH